MLTNGYLALNYESDSALAAAGREKGVTCYFDLLLYTSHCRLMRTYVESHSNCLEALIGDTQSGKGYPGGYRIGISKD